MGASSTKYLTRKEAEALFFKLQAEVRGYHLFTTDHQLEKDIESLEDEVCTGGGSLTYYKITEE